MAMMTISPRFSDLRGDDTSPSGHMEGHLPSARARYAPGSSGGPDPAVGGGRE